MKKTNRRKLLACLLAVILATVMLPATAYAAPPVLTGDGSPENPYKIGTVEELKTFRNIVNNTLTDDEKAAGYTAKMDVCGVLTNNIDLGGSAENPWSAIGSSNYPSYQGVFDGGGYEVTGLYVNSSKSYQGLFGYLGENGSVMNINVAGVVITTSQSAGGVVGFNKGRVMNCSSSVSVTGQVAVGGVVGWNRGIVDTCSYSGVLTGTEKSSYIGGIVGYNEDEFNGIEGIIANSYNTGSISGTGYVGGVVGSNGGLVMNCYNVGDVTGSKEVGGVTGLKFGTVENSYYLSEEPIDEIEKGGTGKTAEQFASGEVAWLLNSGRMDEEHLFRQTCGEGTPTLTGEKVYQVTSYHCPGDTVGKVAYSNTAQDVTGEHSYTKENASDTYLKSAATCTAAAVYWKSCVYCGEPSADETFAYGDVNPDNHTGTSEWSTRTESVHASSYNCCGAVVVPEEPHEWKNNVCTECGYERAAADIPVTGTDIPKTGDNSNLPFWIVLLATSFVCLIGGSVYHRKRIYGHS